MSGLRPECNLLLISKEERIKFLKSRELGLGNFKTYHDAFIVTNFIACLDFDDLKKLESVSIAFAYLTSYEQLWKNLYLSLYGTSNSNFNFLGSWRLLMFDAMKVKPFRPSSLKSEFYSDYLYRPYLYRFKDSLKNEIALLHSLCQPCQVFLEEKISTDIFIHDFEEQRIPVTVKSKLLDEWRIAIEWKELGVIADEPNLGQRIASNEVLQSIVRVGEMNITLEQFLLYCKNCKNEENKLYLFDCNVLIENRHFMDLFKVPDIYKDRDLFESMGKQRPDHSWIIAGTKYTYSKWHIDPNFTHAWNAVVTGRKLWIMLPFECKPCGVIPSHDLTTVTQPVSLAEWFTNYFEQTLEAYGKKLVFTVAEPGDIVFVPSRWWHCVVNLEPTVAITQNYIAKSNLEQALRMMKHQPYLVSGIASSRDKSLLFEQFVSGLKSLQKETINNIIEKVIISNAAKTTMWSKLKKQKHDNFSFAFNIGTTSSC